MCLLLGVFSRFSDAEDFREPALIKLVDPRRQQSAETIRTETPGQRAFESLEDRIYPQRNASYQLVLVELAELRDPTR